MRRELSSGAIVVAISLLSLSLVRGQGVPDRPQGVTAGAWISLNPRLGFVVAPAARAPVAGANALLVAPPVEGYFMIKGETGWSRVVVDDPMKGPGGTG